jgi:predicted transcriptional regulator
MDEHMVNPWVRYNKPKVIKYNKIFVSTKDSKVNPQIADVGTTFTNTTVSSVFNVNINVTLYANDNFYRNLRNLSKSGLDIFTLIIKHVKLDDDYIYIGVSKFAKELDSTIQHVYRGISNLIDNNFITKHKGSLYWINPHYMFKGNKAKKYNTKEVGLDIVKTL